MLPSPEDLEASARARGALRRRRVIRSAPDLLRLVLGYCCGLSLRETGCWSGLQGLGEMSQVGVMKCVRRSADWLEELVKVKLAERAELYEVQGFRFRLVDATTVSIPGSRGIDWRLHLGFDLGSLSIDSVELTSVKGGESLSRFQVGPREVLIGDRGYSHAKGLRSVQQAGGEFLVRMNWQNLPLQTRQGEAFDLFQAARGVADIEAAEFEVQLPATRQLPPLPARLVILRKSAPATEAARKKILREAKKKGRQVDPRTLEAAGYIFLLTSLPADQVSALQALEFYRFRWQIELAFKRLKSLWNFGSVPVKDPDLARSYLYAKLLTALLVEELTETLRSHSPWGFRLQVPSGKPLATARSLVRGGP